MAAEPLERFVSTRAQRVSLDRIDLSLEFAAEEPIHTENS